MPLSKPEKVSQGLWYKISECLKVEPNQRKNVNILLDDDDSFSEAKEEGII
jgi:hypothetical protein